jgi:hypothetical protein
VTDFEAARLTGEEQEYILDHHSCTGTWSDGGFCHRCVPSVAAAATAKALRFLLATIKEKAAYVEHDSGPPCGVWILDAEDMAELAVGIERPVEAKP